MYYQLSERSELFSFYRGLSHRLDGEGCPRKGQRQEEPGPTLRCLTPTTYLVGGLGCGLGRPTGLAGRLKELIIG